MIYIFRNILLFFRDFRKNLPKTFLSSFGIVFLIAFLVMAISARTAVSDYLRKRIFGELKINQIKISPRKQGSLFNTSGPGPGISDGQVRSIRKMEGLLNINEVIRLNYPAYIKAGIFGMYLKTDVFISGVDRSFFRDTEYKWQDFRYKDKLPVAVPLFIVDMYNNYAASNGMPAFSPKILNLMSIDLMIGRSSFFRDDGKEYKYRARLFGFTEKITSAGIIVPSDFIRDFCRTAEGEDKCYSCVMIFADAKDSASIPLVTGKLRSMNLTVESQADIAEKTGRALFLLNLILSAVLGAILILTVIAVFNSYLAVVYNRSHVFSVQRMLGASKARIILFFIIESALAGAVYGIAGYFAGYYSLLYLTDSIPKWSPLVSGLNLRLASHAYLPMAVIFSAAVSSASAFFPALFASNLDLFKAVKR